MCIKDRKSALCVRSHRFGIALVDHLLQWHPLEQDHQFEVSAVGEQVDGDGPLGHEGVPGEGVGGGPRQGNKVLGGGFGVAADEHQCLDVKVFELIFEWEMNLLGENEKKNLKCVKLCYRECMTLLKQINFNEINKLALTAEERRARTAFGWRPARGGSTMATASGHRFRMSGSKNSARPERRTRSYFLAD